MSHKEIGEELIIHRNSVRKDGREPGQGRVLDLRMVLEKWTNVEL